MKETSTRSYYESLSTPELIQIAENEGIYIPHDLERVFIIGELLENLTETKKENEKKEEIIIEESASIVPEPAQLPSYYGLSYIDFLVRDPLWIFVFWEIKNFDRESFEKSPDFRGYFLRVIFLDDENKYATEESEYGGAYTILIDVNDNSRYIGFPSPSSAYGKYIVKLEADFGNSSLEIAESKPIILPKPVTNDDLNLLKENQLIRLSGISEMPVIRTKG